MAKTNKSNDEIKKGWKIKFIIFIIKFLKIKCLKTHPNITQKVFNNSWTTFIDRLSYDMNLDYKEHLSLSLSNVPIIHNITMFDYCKDDDYISGWDDNVNFYEYINQVKISNRLFKLFRKK